MHQPETESNESEKLAAEQAEESKIFSRLRFCVKKDGLSKELFWLSHSNDGSLYVEVSYANPSAVYYGKFSPADVVNGDIVYSKLGTKTDLLPKFVYHQSGETHFSKDPVIRSAYAVQHTPLMALTEQTQIFALNINGNFENFNDFNEEKRKKRDIRDRCRNVVFADEIITIRDDVRHIFRFMMEPAEGFYERHDGLKPGHHFYPTSSGEVSFIYDLKNYRGKDYKCIVVYGRTNTPQNDNHVVLFGKLIPQVSKKAANDDVQFLVLNC